MNEPEDPGGTIPPASNFVTISVSHGKSDMDTDGSFRDTDGSEHNIKRKRTSARRICKHCNKKKRKNHKSSIVDFTPSDCQCELHDLNNKIRESTDKTNSDSTTPHSSQTTDTSRSFTTSRPFYLATDLAPFTIHIQKEQITPNENVRLHPIAFGHFLKKNGFKNIINGSLKRIGRNRISVAFSKFEDANSFLLDKKLSLNHYKAFIPVFNVTRMGVIRGVPVEWSDEEVMDNITVPIGVGKILKVRRLKRKNITNDKVDFVPIETVVLTFDGTSLPTRVYLCYNALPVQLYIYPTIQCFQCCRYGHIKSQCRSLPRCFKCGLGHTGEGCSVDEEDVTCILCSGSHVATSRNCPEFSRQKAIKETMAKSCMTYAEAQKLHPSVSKPYADVLASESQNNFSTNTNTRNHRPIPNYIQTNNSDKKSYKKTVFLKPKAPSSPGKGYDRTGHEALIKGYSSPISPSKSILINSDLNTSMSSMSVKELIIQLISSLSQSNLLSPPSNAAQNIYDHDIVRNSRQNETATTSCSADGGPVELP